MPPHYNKSQQFSNLYFRVDNYDPNTYQAKRQDALSGKHKIKPDNIAAKTPELARYHEIGGYCHKKSLLQPSHTADF